MTLTRPLAPPDWEQLFKEVTFLLIQNVRSWEMNLGRVDACDPNTLRSVARTHQIIKRHAGQLAVEVVEGSNVHRAIRATKLSDSLPLRIIEPIS